MRRLPLGRISTVIAPAVTLVAVLTPSVDVWGQPAAQGGDVPPADPPPVEAPPNKPTTSPPPADAAPPTVFPGVVQGGVVAARPASVRPWTTQRNFAIFAAQGSYSGFGLGLRGGSLRIGVDASFAFFPIFATYSANPERFPEFKLLSSFQANGSLYIGLYRPEPRTDFGIAFGYKYNSLLQHGVNVAFYFQREFSAHWTLQGFIGPTIFPAAEDRIRNRTGWEHGSVSSGMAWHQAGLGVSLAFFP